MSCLDEEVSTECVLFIFYNKFYYNFYIIKGLEKSNPFTTNKLKNYCKTKIIFYSFFVFSSYFFFSSFKRKTKSTSVLSLIDL